MVTKHPEESIVSEVEISAGSTKRSRLRWMVAMVCAAGAVSYIALFAAPAPFFWIWLAWASVLFGGIAFMEGSWPKAILLNLGLIACLLAAAEGYLGFRDMGIPLDRAEDILPGYRTNELKYVLSSADHHPNALADSLLAQHVLREIVP